ncbi:hypothetical protein CA13_63540 [Planctomycetes bacterium CA13]|uniref:Uncharacterized protein n=1 Tax=Novipirellula herctigrandis TaxID=2527986 RepID=A0A5C5ZEB3_9BACT|nr:hypothetical protein CA13_63540 [Planctomycetes bacterium CA13]
MNCPGFFLAIVDIAGQYFRSVASVSVDSHASKVDAVWPLWSA